MLFGSGRGLKPNRWAFSGPPAPLRADHTGQQVTRLVQKIVMGLQEPAHLHGMSLTR